MCSLNDVHRNICRIFTGNRLFFINLDFYKKEKRARKPKIFIDSSAFFLRESFVVR